MLSNEQNQLIEASGFTYLFCINKMAVVVVPTGEHNPPKAVLLNFNGDQTKITGKTDVFACTVSRQVFFTEQHYEYYIAECRMLNSYHALEVV